MKFEKNESVVSAVQAASLTSYTMRCCARREKKYSFECVHVFSFDREQSPNDTHLKLESKQNTSRKNYDYRKEQIERAERHGGKNSISRRLREIAFDLLVIVKAYSACVIIIHKSGFARLHIGSV